MFNRQSNGRALTAAAALLGAAFWLGPSAPAAARVRTMAGQWGAPPSTPGDRNAMLTISQSAAGRFTIHGQWVGGGDWGTGPVTGWRDVPAGTTGIATLHGFYPTLNLQLRFSRHPVSSAEDTIVLKMHSQWVQDGAVQNADLPDLTFRRMLNE